MTRQARALWQAPLEPLHNLGAPQAQALYLVLAMLQDIEQEGPQAPEVVVSRCALRLRRSTRGMPLTERCVMGYAQELSLAMCRQYGVVPTAVMVEMACMQ